jgi:carboxylesterase type B
LPVYVFIQGGGFNSDSDANHNGSAMIITSDYDLVIVTFNYRVGPYGFLTSKEVQADGDLNAGLLDQRKVLQWVQKYISRVWTQFLAIAMLTCESLAAIPTM